MKYFIFLSAIFTGLCCTQKNESFETTEEQRNTARENSGYLARAWRADTKNEDYDIMLRGDSTISPRCPQGDGWASIDLINKRDNQMMKLKCSTYSRGVGCLLEQDFKQRSEYANQDGSCNKDVPFPLPKIAN